MFFQNTLFLKEYLACNGSFRLYSKIKKRSGTSFWCKFSAWFFLEDVPYLMLYQWTQFQRHTLFPSQDITQNVLLSSYLDSWWRLNVKIFLWSTSKAMADKKEKRGRQNKKTNLGAYKNFFWPRMGAYSDWGLSCFPGRNSFPDLVVFLFSHTTKFKNSLPANIFLWPII